MSQETQTNDMQSVPGTIRNKRIRIAEDETIVTALLVPVGNAEGPTKLKNPHEAAIAKGTEFVRSLHKDLQTFVEDYQTIALRAFASLYYKEIKLQQMIYTPDYILSNCRFKCPLKIHEDARQDKEFSTLEGR